MWNKILEICRMFSTISQVFLPLMDQIWKPDIVTIKTKEPVKLMPAKLKPPLSKILAADIAFFKGTG